MDNQGVAAAQMEQDFAHLAHQRTVRNSQDLMRRVRWIGEWPENIKYGADTNLATCWGDVFHGWMVGWGKHKAKATFLYAAGCLCWCKVDFCSKRFQYVSTATFTRGRAIAVLGNFCSCGSCNNTYDGC